MTLFCFLHDRKIMTSISFVSINLLCCLHDDKRHGIAQIPFVPRALWMSKPLKKPVVGWKLSSSSPSRFFIIIIMLKPKLLQFPVWAPSKRSTFVSDLWRESDKPADYCRLLAFFTQPWLDVWVKITAISSRGGLLRASTLELPFGTQNNGGIFFYESIWKLSWNLEKLDPKMKVIFGLVSWQKNPFFPSLLWLMKEKQRLLKSSRANTATISN